MLPEAQDPSVLARRTPFDRGVWTTFFVVAMALVVNVLEADFSWNLVLEAGVLSLAYIGLTVGFGDRLDRESPWPAKLVFFALQLAVLFALSRVFVDYRVFAVTWLFHMPLVAQSRMLLPASGTAAACASSLGVLVYHVQVLGGWDDVPGSLFALFTAVAFVLVFTDIAMREATARADSQRLSLELEEANRQLSQYAVQAEELSAVRERERMAREIHDSVGHSLTAVNMQVEVARTMLERDVEKSRHALDKAQTCVRDGLAEIRRSVSSLRSDPLEGRNLHGALADLADLASSAGLATTFRVRGSQRPLTEAVTLTLFRCAQEGLTNAKKHARADRVDLEVDYGGGEDGHGEDGHGEDGHGEDRVHLRIVDDGVGCERPEGGFGLLGVRERVRQQGGSLEIYSKPGEGLRLDVELPTPLAALAAEPEEKAS